MLCVVCWSRVVVLRSIGGVWLICLFLIVVVGCNICCIVLRM